MKRFSFVLSKKKKNYKETYIVLIFFDETPLQVDNIYNTYFIRTILE